jgi:hypothetical protein
LLPAAHFGTRASRAYYLERCSRTLRRYNDSGEDIMATVTSIILSTAMRRIYWLAVLLLPIAMMTPWSNSPVIGFTLGLGLGLAVAGLLVSLTAGGGDAGV